MSNYKVPDGIDIWAAENIFYLNSDISRMARFVAQYELYKKIAGLPGAIVECGVYKGASLSRFAAFRSMLENERARKIYGFDAFGQFPRDALSLSADLTFVEKFEAAGGAGIEVDDLEAILAAKGHTNIELVKGNVFDTVPATLERDAHLRIALLHLDLDVFEPTQFCLEHFLPRMVPGGLIVFDDYNAVEGASRVADAICVEKGLRLSKLPFYNVPAFVELP